LIEYVSGKGWHVSIGSVHTEGCVGFYFLKQITWESLLFFK